MRVLYDHQIFSIQEYGGISRYFYELMHTYENSGAVKFSVSVSCTNNRYLRQLESQQGVRDCQSSFLQNGFLRKLWIQKNKYEINENTSRKALSSSQYDIIHPTYYNPYILEHGKGKPVILTVHDMIHERFPELFSLADPTISMKRKLLEHADQIICVSDYTRKNLHDIYPDLDASRIHVIYHGAPSWPDGAEQKDDGDRKNLLYVGPRGSYKNFYFFLVSVVKILKEYPQIEIICAGGGAFSEEESTFFSHLGIRKRIHHYSVGDVELAALYRDSLALIIPSLCEGFGFPVLEAFSCGCPVVCSREGSLPEIAQDASVYFEPKDSRSIQEALGSVISDSRLRNRIVEKGLRYVQKYRWSDTAELTRDVYAKALAH